MKKEATVVMLPTDKKVEQDSICLHSKFGLGVHSSSECSYDGSIRQELYITDDSEIKEGDYAYDKQTESIYKVGKFSSKAGHYAHSIIPLKSDVEEGKTYTYVGKRYSQYSLKIIATTNFELMVQGSTPDSAKEWKKIFELPQIPQSFIESYCKNPIDKVLVEYTSTEIGEFDGVIAYDWDCIPKLTSNNEIIISKIEEKLYTREEVDVMKQALKMLLECPSLNQDDLESYDVEAVEFATEVYKEIT